jgi:hypothetical protein
MSTVPQELDWVSKRAACNVGHVFDELCVGIAKDVEAINAAQKLEEHNHFASKITSNNNTIVVGQEGRLSRVVVKIGIIGDFIAVNDATKSLEWRAKVALNREGRCILKLEDGAELEQWQFRKKALEGLFFED